MSQPPSDLVLKALCLAYLKHHYDDQRIGWLEVEDALWQAINTLPGQGGNAWLQGDDAFVAWLEQRAGLKEVRP
jgi:hypothetical protein